MGFNNAPSGVSVTNFPIKMLIVYAYDIREGLVFGLPAWAESTHFDINAKVTDADPEALKRLTPAQRREMMAAMLVERFHLKVHAEVKTLPVYDLVIAKGGPKLKEHAVPPEEVGPAKPKTGMGPGSFLWNFGEASGVAVPLSTLERLLEGTLDRTIIDKTGLTGKYDFHLTWAPDSASAEPTAAPPLFTALGEQLGLKLVPSKGPVATLVVDHIEQPSEN